MRRRCAGKKMTRAREGLGAAWESDGFRFERVGGCMDRCMRGWVACGCMGGWVAGCYGVERRFGMGILIVAVVVTIVTSRS